MRYISTLLTHLGYPILPGEQFYDQIPIFTPAAWKLSYRSCCKVVSYPLEEDDETAAHVKWTRHYQLRPHLAPPGFIPYSAWRQPLRAPTDQQQGEHSQTAQQGEAAWEQAMPQQQEQGGDNQWRGDTELVPPEMPIGGRRRKRRAGGEGTSASGASGQPDQGMEQLLASMQGLQLGFDTMRGQFGEVPLYQRMDQLHEQFQTHRTEFDQFRDQTQTQLQAIQTDFGEFRGMYQAQQEQYQAQQDQFQAYRQDFDQFRAENQAFQTGFQQFQHRTALDFQQQNGNFYELRTYDQEILSQHYDAARLDAFAQQAEEEREDRHQPPFNPHQD